MSSYPSPFHSGLSNHTRTTDAEGPVSLCLCGLVDHWEPGEDEPRAVYKICPIHPNCTCNDPAIAKVTSYEQDEDFYFYKRCPVHSKGVKHIMEVETLSELKKLGFVNLTEAGKKWLSELEEKENKSALEKRSSRWPHKPKKPRSTRGGATKFKTNRRRS